MTFEISEFDITYEHILNFRKIVQEPRYYMINAMEYMNILSKKCADFMRFSVNKNGVSLSQFLEILKYIFPNYLWKNSPISFSNLQNFVTLIMKPNKIIFCNAEINNQCHIFLLYKNIDNEVIYINPLQQILLNIKDPKFSSDINQLSSFHVLKVKSIS